RADPGTGRRPARRESIRRQAGTSLDRARIPGYCRRQTALIKYRRGVRTPSLRKAAAPLAGVVVVLAGCAAEESAPPTETTVAGPCSIIANGTPAPNTTGATRAGVSHT